MRWSYLFKHWFSTLLVGTLFFMLVMGFQNEEGVSMFVNLLKNGLWAFLGIGLYLSIPTYAVYALLFYFLRVNKVQLLYAKAILLFTAQLGIWLTFYLLLKADFSGFVGIIVFSYAITSLVTGMLFRLSTAHKGNFNLSSRPE